MRKHAGFGSQPYVSSRVAECRSRQNEVGGTLFIIDSTLWILQGSHRRDWKMPHSDSIECLYLKAPPAGDSTQFAWTGLVIVKEISWNALDLYSYPSKGW